MNRNYYISSFGWSTVGKLLNAAVNFFSIPLLISLWGKQDYGVLTLAIACNSYLSLVDLGLNIGAVRYFSIWIKEHKIDILHRVANSNTIFYSIVALINILCLLIIALFGETWFKLNHEQFLTLRSCLFILIIFSFPTWITTSFNQLLIANSQIAFTQKTYCVITLLKGLAIYFTIIYGIHLRSYYFIITLITASTLIPYYLKCKKSELIGKIFLRFGWNEFKPILVYSLAVFSLSFFQITASQSRPIILGIFSSDAAVTLSEYRIIEVVPLFVLAIGGSLTSIFLPKSSAMISQNNICEIKEFAYRGTKLTSILACTLTFPFIIGASEFLSAYVGEGYNMLAKWEILWAISVLIQIHTTPGNSLILASGRVKPLVFTSAFACIVSIIINGALCEIYNVGSAVIGYFIYVCIVIGAYYIFYYNSLLSLSRKEMFKSFLIPLLPALLSYLLTFLLCRLIPTHGFTRLNFILLFILKSAIWMIIYVILLFFMKLIRFDKQKFIIT